MKEQALVSIITVNYNQSTITAELLDSLSQITYQNIEIIVVDNASPNDNVKWLTVVYPQIKLIHASENLGFAGGNNLGIQAAQGKYCLFINNDTTVEPNFLEPLIDCCEKQANVGMVGARLMYAYEQDKIQFAGAKLNRYTAQIKWKNRKLSELRQRKLLEKTDLVHGAAMLIPTEVIQKVGMMPEAFFLLYEEFDWAEKIRRAGYDLYYVGRSKVYHKVSMTMKNSPFKSYYMARNRLLFIRRNFKGFQFWMSLLFTLFMAYPKIIFQMLFRREWTLIRATFRGIFWHLKPRNKPSSSSQLLKNKNYAGS